MMDTVLYVVFPYVATVLAVVVGVYRYRQDRYSYSSFSSQFLESRWLFWGSVNWHYAILAVLLAHLLAALFPGLWGKLLSHPFRRLLLEVTGWALGFAAAAGLGALILRRLQDPKLRALTTLKDWLVGGLLFLQVTSGLVVAVRYRWGGLWYVDTAAQWLASLAKLKPDTSAIAPLPALVKAHFLLAFVLVALFPFSRLVHIVSVPFGYLWRPYQLVHWYRRATSDVPRANLHPHEEGGAQR